MHLCHVLLYHDPGYAAPQSFLDRSSLLRYLPQAVAARGHRVDVVASFGSDHTFEEGSVRYQFTRSAAPWRLTSSVLGRLLQRHPAAVEPAFRAIRTVRSLHPDVLHLHGTNLYLNHTLLLAALGRNHPPIVLQYHGGFPSPNSVARRAQQRIFSHPSRFLFTTKDHAQPFVDAGLIDDPRHVVAFMETSSHFSVQDRADARRRTGMVGHPVFLMAGRLDAVKDPMTALRGFEHVLAKWPGAHLYLHYLGGSLLPDLRAYVARRPTLREHVHFAGRVPPARMEAIYNSADFLVQASHREFSGCAVLEAMACGVVPVVTDIPSFRAMTACGIHGVLFPPGDDEALAHGVLAVPITHVPERSHQVRAWFEQALSFPALAERAEAVYQEVLLATHGAAPPPHTSAGATPAPH